MVSRCVCQSAPVRALVVPVCCERGVRIRILFLGDDEWRKTELVARVERALKPLEGILKLRDTKEIHTAQQVMQVLLRFCSNTTLTFFLRAMPPSVTPSRQRRGTTS